MLRVGVIGIICLSLFVALFSRLYYLQVLRPTSLEEVRPVPTERVLRYPAERGRILDRTGQRVLVDSRQSINVTINRTEYEAVANKAGLRVRVAELLNRYGLPTKATDIESRLLDPRFDPLKPVPIVEDVSAELEIVILERTASYPSVDTERVWQRVYPSGAVASHLVGYVGAINQQELEAQRRKPVPYEPDDQIGKTGVEYIFESDLRGTPSERRVLVDLRGQEVGTAAEAEPRAGSDLILTIDLELQRRAEQLLAEALLEARGQTKRRPQDPDITAPAGSVVVLDVQTGEVLADASFPSYDPAEFVGGISAYRFNELNAPAARNPLLNRTTQSAYAPGSTFKPITAYAALLRGLIDPAEEWLDRGSYVLENCDGSGCEFQNAGRTAYGPVDFNRSLVVSSDTYYYRLGERLWVERAQFGETPLQDAATQFGFGRPTGIELPDENAGLVSDPASKRQRNAENPAAFPYGDWFTGDNVNLAIGQGDLAVTPLQLANAYAALANGGRLLAPSVVRALVDPSTGVPTRTFEPREVSRIDLPPTIRQLLDTSLANVARDEEGTAYVGFEGFPLQQFPVAGKTGTAQVQGKADTALFAAYGPVGAPRYAVVAVLEESGFGAEVAVPLVRRIFEQLPEVQALTSAAAPEVPPPNDEPHEDAVPQTPDLPAGGSAAAEDGSATAPAPSVAPGDTSSPDDPPLATRPPASDGDPETPTSLGTSGTGN